VRDNACVGSVRVETVMIRGARVFDGVAVTDADSVVVRDGLIVEVGVGLPAPEGAEVVDAPGGTLLPGLIDAHTTCCGSPSWRRRWCSG
jgi:imidazolonepropionase-like amidohydrolase